MGALPCQDYLEELDFIVDQPEAGLLVVGHDYSNTNISPKQRLDLEIAEAIGADAVYFQQFEGERQPQPQIYIFDRTKSMYIEDNELAKIHRKLWSGMIVPIYFVFTKTEFQIYNARKPIKTEKDVIKAPNYTDCFDFDVQSIHLAQQAFEEYNESKFRTGEFWRNKSQYYRYDQTAGECLLKELINCRDAILENVNPNLHEGIKHLLMSGIFVKYLEERNRILPEGFFARFSAEKSSDVKFSDVVRQGKNALKKAFQYLNTQFNGDLFKDILPLKGMSKTELTLLADFLDAKVSNNNYVLWPKYDFDYIPIEVISRIYEEFVPQEKDVVYTPPHLANLMVDECLPLKASNEKPKICDPSCGSGIFLVTAFRRLAQRHRLAKAKAHSNKIPELLLSEAKEIMTSCLYGMDKSNTALDLAVLSLSIALCDILPSSETQKRFRFDKLKNKNLICKDFCIGHKSWVKNFDIVIGNPPFGSTTQKVDWSVNGKAEGLPGREASLLFLRDSMNWLRPNGKAAFVLSTVPMLYSSINGAFHQEFHKKYTVQQVFDFSLLRDQKVLFNRMVSTVALFVENRVPGDDDVTINHIVVRRTSGTKARIAFEIDDYDFHGVPRHLVNDPHIWKSNLMGGWGVYSIVKRLEKLDTLLDFLRGKKSSDWVWGEGYTIGGPKAKKSPAKWLTGRFGIVKSPGHLLRQKVKKPMPKRLKTKLFTASRNKKIFDSPHLIIHKSISAGHAELDFVLESNSLVFSNSYIGIHAPKGEKQDLNKIQCMLKENARIYTFFLVASSHRMGVGRSGASVLQSKDIMSLPLINNPDQMPTLSESEDIIVDDVLKYGMDMLNNHEDAQISSPVTRQDMENYLRTFCKKLNDAYQCRKNKMFRADWTMSNSGVLVYACIRYCDKNDIVLSDDNKNALHKQDMKWAIEHGQQSSDVFYKRIIRVSRDNFILFAKPVALRYWLRSIALRDAANAIIDIERND